ncbi:hypothetical protein HORIV_48680 [Vreelandella olivaria]|uniref:Circularly permuted ATP-grasp type 2 domain-containing protein n=1 Tax=Vreelandella olivaria TaxID=390919 RepID=A0ABN5X2X1_9GAMM|nr:hypothetical protein HORIV_48680 [Halomonas olivaria]
MDVIQDTQGQWRVIADRLQAPSGTGFALENRILMARALPDMYRNAPLKRLAGFLDLHHRTLIAMAYQHRDNPTLILLTPGPGSPRYFEHAYLANYLNIALVEGRIWWYAMPRYGCAPWGVAAGGCDTAPLRRRLL